MKEMDNSIKINLAGIVFQVEEDAYRLLRDYLNAIETRLKGTPGSTETLDDIEARIAEILESRKGIAGVITRENVEEVIEIIGQPEDFEQEAPENGYIRTETPGRRRLYRNPDDKIIAGVSGGIGAYLNIDPVWIRIAFIIFMLPYGIGFFAYVALWISLPLANTESQKNELYGSHFRSAAPRAKNEYKAPVKSEPGYHNAAARDSSAGSAVNEIFRAIGKGFYVFFRIILVIVGISFLFAGIGLIVTFFMAFFFNIPWFFFDDSLDAGLFYAPDFLNFFLSPGLAPWVMVLATIAILLPLLALIYWGIRMIFWFRAKDWVVSLVALVIWIASISALAMIFFNEGISFAESATRNEQLTDAARHDTLYILVDRKVSDLRYDKVLRLPDDQYALYMKEAENELFGRPELGLHHSHGRNVRIEVEKYSHGKTKREAAEKASSFIYNYRFKGDTLYIDQYYEIPVEQKWSASNLEVDIFIPDDTVIWIDRECEEMFSNYLGNGVRSWETGDRFWLWTGYGLERIQ